MIYIERENEPEFWSQYQKKHPGADYDDLNKTEEGKEVRKRIREFNIDQQHGLRAYCCKRITIDDSVNEHIKPRGRYSDLSMKYSNIVASCREDGTNRTCSASKRDQYDEHHFISPLELDCEAQFRFYRTGEIISETANGNYTIGLLNLNSYKLCKARKAKLKECESYCNDDLVREYFLKPDEQNKLEPYVDIIRFFYTSPKEFE